MNRILVTGGAGFIGSHVTEYYAKKGWQVIAYDNLSRAKLLGKNLDVKYNWNYLSALDNVTLVEGDVRDSTQLEPFVKDVNVIVHTAGQTAVTTSTENPALDFSVNVQGIFYVLEAARKLAKDSTVIYGSTNKVYGDNVNKVGIIEGKTRYSFESEYAAGISEDFGVDLCKHTPYGCSKLCGDLYVQEYAHLYGLKTGVFRMSCIYGTRQLGVEDQGWVAWFVIATLLNKQITIFGDGKQVRDILFITDLLDVFDKFIHSDIKSGVFNIGGGAANTISLLEFLDMLEEMTGKRSQIFFKEWRASDQKVYISDISKAQKLLGWQPTVSQREGIRMVITWVENNRNLFM
jgi:CDP-paratose 2-epimerase